MHPHRDAQGLGNAPRTPARHERHLHARLDEHLLAAHDALIERDRSAAHFVCCGDHLEHIVHARGLAELDLHRAHHEGEARRLLLGLLEQRSPLAAETILARIDKKFDQLTWFPFIGRERSSLAPGLRSAVVGTHLIPYTIQNDNIIVRVIDGRMDIDEEFRR